MRLLIVGSNQIYAIENFYVKYMKQLGVEVSLFTAQNYFYEYYNNSVFNKILYKSSLSGIVTRINNLFRKTVERLKPEIIWIFKGMEITPASLEWAKGKGIKLVNYNPDNPFIFSGKGSGNLNVVKSIPIYDLHFTYNLNVKERLEADYHIRTAFLPFGFDLENSLYRICEEQEEVIKVCFAGNPDKERAEFIESLAQAGIQVDVYGHNWNRFISNSSINLSPALYGDEFWKVLRRYRIQLNLMRLHNEDSHNMRSFEVPAVGGVMLAPDTREHRLFFADQSEVFLFSGIHHCIEQVGILLELPKWETDEIRRKSRERSLKAGYSYKQRTYTALQELKEIVY